MNQIEQLKKSFDVMQQELAKALSKLPESLTDKKTELLSDMAEIKRLVKANDEAGLNKLAKKYASHSPQ
jgi:hypothetical protein